MTRRVVITGACGGLGRAMVATFRAEGWHVVGIDRNEPDDGVQVDDFVLADIGADGEVADFADMFEDSRLDSPEDSIARTEEFQVLLKLIEAIDERDARVLKLRFGLEGQEPLTLKQIGEEVGLTRERVRQIEVDALKKLQSQLQDDHPSRYFRENRDDAETPSRKSKRRAKAS